MVDVERLDFARGCLNNGVPGRSVKLLSFLVAHPSEKLDWHALRPKAETDRWRKRFCGSVELKPIDDIADVEEISRSR